MDLTSEAAIDEPPDKVDETEIESQLITLANGPTEYALLLATLGFACECASEHAKQLSSAYPLGQMRVLHCIALPHIRTE